MKHDYCLLAVDGDCSAGAMADKNSVLPVQKRHLKAVAKFLKADLAWRMASALNDISYSYKDPLFIAISKTSWRLRELGVFHHKWHARTGWILVERDCLEDGSIYGNNWKYEKDIRLEESYNE